MASRSVTTGHPTIQEIDSLISPLEVLGFEVINNDPSAKDTWVEVKEILRRFLNFDDAREGIESFADALGLDYLSAQPVAENGSTA